jgi:monovalent cation:H+ antiporter-2, CPA2 family
MFGSLFVDLLLILSAGLVSALICRRLQVSVLIGYLLVGVVIGKSGLGFVGEAAHEIQHLAEIGVFLLLFSIGLEFSLEELARLGRGLLIGGSIQMSLVAIPVFVGLWLSGLPTNSAILIGSAVSFSSTVLVFKVLSEWGQSSRPHGQRAIGILLFQDVALVPLLLLVPLLTGSGESAHWSDYVLLALRSVLFVATILTVQQLLSRWGMAALARYGSPELVILFTVVVLGAITAYAFRMGLPAAIGAFAAGLVFSGNRWSRQIDALVLPMRETFAAIFFVSLGLLLDLRIVLGDPLILITALLGLIAIKAMAAIVALRVTGLNWPLSIRMGIGLAHVGEFALVLLLLGWESGILAELAYQRTVAISIGSLILTPLLLRTGLRMAQESATPGAAPSGQPLHETQGRRALIIGAGPIGRHIASRLETAGKDVCLIDLSPINLHPFAQEGFRTVAGDARDAGTLQIADASKAAAIIVCVPNDEIAIEVVRAVRSENPSGFILVRCRFQATIGRVRRAGADGVVSEESEAMTALLKILTAVDESIPAPG